ncbi:hypothetical protein ACQP3C_28875, partial [Escherichia coli]
VADAMLQHSMLSTGSDISSSIDDVKTGSNESSSNLARHCKEDVELQFLAFHTWLHSRHSNSIRTVWSKAF